MMFVEFKDDFEANITACLGCETIVTFADLWYDEYCCKSCWTLSNLRKGDKN